MSVSINIVEPGEAKTEMNQGSNIPPSVINDVIDYLLSKDNHKGFNIIDRDKNILKFCHEIENMYV